MASAGVGAKMPMEGQPEHPGHGGLAVEVEIIEKSMACIRDSLDRLSVRLQPLLVPENPTPAETTGPDDPPSSPFTAHVRGHRRQLQAINLRLLDLLERLDG